MAAPLTPNEESCFQLWLERSIAALGGLAPTPDRDRAIAALQTQLENRKRQSQSNLIAFPERNKGRKRRCRGMEAAGDLSLLLLDRDGEPAPENVERIVEPEGVTTPPPSAALLLGIVVLSVLTDKQKQAVRSAVRVMALGDKNPLPEATQLHNLLSGRR
jgi:hypothetical protein